MAPLGFLGLCDTQGFCVLFFVLGVELLVNFFEVGVGDVSVYLGGSNIAMTKHCLDAT